MTTVSSIPSDCVKARMGAEVETCFVVGVFGLASVRACDSCLIETCLVRAVHTLSLHRAASTVAGPLIHALSLSLVWHAAKTPTTPQHACITTARHRGVFLVLITYERAHAVRAFAPLCVPSSRPSLCFWEEPMWGRHLCGINSSGD